MQRLRAIVQVAQDQLVAARQQEAAASQHFAAHLQVSSVAFCMYSPCYSFSAFGEGSPAPCPFFASNLHPFPSPPPHPPSFLPGLVICLARLQLSSQQLPQAVLHAPALILYSKCRYLWDLSLTHPSPPPSPTTPPLPSAKCFV